MSPKHKRDPLETFHPAVQRWFRASFPAPTRAQLQGWPPISTGESTLLLAPTGSGKTLTAFLWCLDRLMFSPVPESLARCRVVYVSPLKALAVDVERNLRAPMVGIANAASALGDDVYVPEVSIRTGDTPAKERARFARAPSDILITTPESLYLILTSAAREALRYVETVIIDEIHALVPTKRGAHLALSLERLEEITLRSPQRIGLSATQRPLDEVAHFLGGAEPRIAVVSDERDDSAEETIDREFRSDSDVIFRPVTIVDTGERKQLEIRVEVPVEDMAEIGKAIEIPTGPASQSTSRTSIWPAIHPRLLELIRDHRSTLIFVNSRRLAERLAAALNELAGEHIAAAHHGSLAPPQRSEIEDALKSGTLPALVATSSLELGIDMGAIDLVIQIESPPSIASGMQRIGRGGHQVGAVSRGIMFPKYRGDLVACAATAEAMTTGSIEATRYPRNPLDVLAQQIVAMSSVDAWNADALFDAVRRAAPFAQLGRGAFEGVLDMLSGAYPSDEFAELRARVTWNRVDGSVVARRGAKQIAVLNAGTIPDRGLYGVFLVGSERGSARVGELDEEMVFECRVGETFVLGASTWRIEDITHDRVLVTPAPGEPGKTPFWHGDAAGRSVELGRRIGALLRKVSLTPEPESAAQLQSANGLDARAARNLIDYVSDQREATSNVPDDRTVIVEKSRDELGDWRICVLSPLGGRVLAPWAMAILAKVRQELAIDVEAMWSDDGLIVRFPDTDVPPATHLLIPTSAEVESLVIRQIGASSLFAAKFREVASRALLLPRRRGARRAPLWQQRKRASDLLQVASRFGSFPMLLETYRECLRDVFDMPSLIETMRAIEQRSIRVMDVETEHPSPFAGSILFRYVANYLYDGDAPLAERRAQALSIDQEQLRELLGEAELRELLDADVIAELEVELQGRRADRAIRDADGLHDLLLRLGDLSREEIALRSAPGSDAVVGGLLASRRAIEVSIEGERRVIAIEDASRYRDSFGVPLPHGVPERFLRSVAEPLLDVLSRFARTRGPFTFRDVEHRYALPRAIVERTLHQLAMRGRLQEGEFIPGGTQREWCDAAVLRTIRRRSLARLRREIEPVEAATYTRFLAEWHSAGLQRQGPNAVVDALDLLQGCPIVASTLESDIMPARVGDFKSSDLDALISSGSLIWLGVEPLGESDGRLAFYFADQLALLAPIPSEAELPPAEAAIVEFLRLRGASFFRAIHEGIGGGFPEETLDAIWSLVWRGLLTNDTLHALRAWMSRSARSSRARRAPPRIQRLGPAGSEGRWSLAESLTGEFAPPLRRVTALAQQLLTRYGVLAREAAAAESIAGGFGTLYDVLKAMEGSGKLRRGYFVSGIAAMQFAIPPALDRLRSMRELPSQPVGTVFASTDPVNPYGALLPWPSNRRGAARSAGSHVVLVDGNLAAWVARGEKDLTLFLPEDEPLRTRNGRAVAEALAAPVRAGKRRALFISEIDHLPAATHPFGEILQECGFTRSALGWQLRSPRPPLHDEDEAEESVSE